MTILTAGRVTAKQIINKHSAIFLFFLRHAVSFFAQQPEQDLPRSHRAGAFSSGEFNFEPY